VFVCVLGLFFLLWGEGLYHLKGRRFFCGKKGCNASLSGRVICVDCICWGEREGFFVRGGGGAFSRWFYECKKRLEVVIIEADFSFLYEEEMKDFLRRGGRVYVWPLHSVFFFFLVEI